MASTPNRRYLTQWLSGELNSNDIVTVIVDPPVGDWAGGWSDDPKAPGSYYQPYTVLLPLTSGEPEGSFFDPGEIWMLPYALTSYAVSARSLEDQTDTARRIVSETEREKVDLGGVLWQVMSARSTSIGGVDINRSVEPAVFSQRDLVLVSISRKGPV